jgi:hypothetical protein
VLPDRQDRVLAAANAAAGWIRARRVLWDEPQLDLGDVLADVRTPAEFRQFEYVAAPEPLEVLAETGTPAEATVPGDTATPVHGSRVFGVVTSTANAAVETGLPFVAAGAVAWTRAIGKPLVRALPAVLAVALLVGGVAAGRAYWLTTTFSKAAIVPADSRSVEPPDRAGKRIGGLAVTSDPTGARVRADGVVRGVTPLTLEGLAAGVHTIVIESAQGSVQRSVTVKAGQTSQVAATIFAGWLKVYSPFELTITEGARRIRLDDHNQVLLPPGPHELGLENTLLSYHAVRRVDVRPGETTSLSVVPSGSTLNVTANEPADVSIDGVKVGQTPLADVPAELGTREIVLTSGSGEERRLIVTLTAKPAQVNVDFSKPAP